MKGSISRTLYVDTKLHGDQHIGGKTALSFPEATLKTHFDLSSHNHRDCLA